MSTNNYQYKDPISLYKWSKILISLSIGMHVIAVVSGFMEYKLLTGILNGAYANMSYDALYSIVEHNDLRETIVGIIQLILFLIQGIVILMWIHRANNNVRALGAQAMTFSPGWSVGWYFIPVLHLWKPYQAMKEIFLKSEALTPNTPNNKRYLLPTWWTLWIISEVIGRIILRRAMKGDLDTEGYIKVSVLHQFSDAFDILLNIVFLLIITAIYKWQLAYKNQQLEGGMRIDQLIKR